MLAFNRCHASPDAAGDAVGDCERQAVHTYGARCANALSDLERLGMTMPLLYLRKEDAIPAFPKVTASPPIHPLIIGSHVALPIHSTSKNDVAAPLSTLSDPPEVCDTKASTYSPTANFTLDSTLTIVTPELLASITC